MQLTDWLGHSLKWRCCSIMTHISFRLSARENAAIWITDAQHLLSSFSGLGFRVKIVYNYGLSWLCFCSHLSTGTCMWSCKWHVSQEGPDVRGIEDSNSTVSSTDSWSFVTPHTPTGSPPLPGWAGMEFLTKPVPYIEKYQAKTEKKTLYLKLQIMYFLLSKEKGWNEMAQKA